MKKNPIIPYDPSLREAAKELRKKATIAEITLWKYLRRRQLGVQFHRQVPIDRFIIDFYCHEIMLAIEVDGGYHLSVEQQVIDGEKDRRLNHFGIHVIRLTNDEVLFDHESALLLINTAISQRISVSSLEGGGFVSGANKDGGCSATGF